MVTVTMRETYDLSTKVNKMGMIAIHTPSMDTISRMWSGLVQNHKFIKIEKCDIRMACASVLPADPLQVGVEAGDIAPQDMFNPILYSAVSNDLFGTIQARLYTLGYFNHNATASADYDPEPLPGDIDNWGVYYSMLASQGWKKAMPQAGLDMKSLRPLVHELSVNHGSMFLTDPKDPEVDSIRSWQLADGASIDVFKNGALFKGPSKPMPAIPTMYYTGEEQVQDQYATSLSAKPTILPATYVAMLLMPPAKLNVMYFRLSVKWCISFIGPRPNTELSNLTNLAYEGLNRFYYTDYAEQSKGMTSKTEMVDTRDVDITKVM